MPEAEQVTELVDDTFDVDEIQVEEVGVEEEEEEEGGKEGGGRCGWWVSLVHARLVQGWVYAVAAGHRRGQGAREQSEPGGRGGRGG